MSSIYCVIILVIFWLKSHRTYNANTVRTKAMIGFRKDYKCGKMYPLPDGSPSYCNSHGSHHCCNYHLQTCGSSSLHCNCIGCTDFRVFHDESTDNSKILTSEDTIFILTRLSKSLELSRVLALEGIQHIKKVNINCWNLVLHVGVSNCLVTESFRHRNCLSSGEAYYVCFVTLHQVENRKLLNQDCLPVFREVERNIDNKEDLKTQFIRVASKELSNLEGSIYWYMSRGILKYKQIDSEHYFLTLKLSQSDCKTTSPFNALSNCGQIENGPIKTCDFQMSSLTFKVLSYSCFAESSQWTNWSLGTCFFGVKRRIRLCSLSNGSENCLGNECEDSICE